MAQHDNPVPQSTRQPSCKARWASAKNGRLSDISRLWRAYTEGEDTAYAQRVQRELGEIHEYGLAFDYVAPHTFGKNQRRGYWRWQLGYGGPSDEIRFYADHPQAREADRIEYTFQDWFDGYTRKLTGKDESLLQELWTWFSECGSCDAEYNKATADGAE